MSKRARKDKRHRPSEKKQPVIAETPVTNLRVEWCFRLFDDFEWNGDSDSEESFRKVALHLKDYSSRTWKQIIQNKKRDHPVNVSELIRKAQQRLEDLNLGDHDLLWRFRFDGRKRIWGIKHEHVFRVLWWDPQHRICPSQKSHT